MNAARASLVALILCWTFAFGQLAAFAQVPVPPLSGPVVDQTGTLSSDEIDSLAKKIRDFEARKGSQISVLIVPTTQPEEIEQYSIRVAEAWKIGRNKIDDGAILLVAKNDRKLRIEVGYGLEGALTDVTTRRIIDEIITPRFRNGDFAGGISAGVDRIISVIDGEPLPPPPPVRHHRGAVPRQFDAEPAGPAGRLGGRGRRGGGNGMVFSRLADLCSHCLRRRWAIHDDQRRLPLRYDVCRRQRWLVRRRSFKWRLEFGQRQRLLQRRWRQFRWRRRIG
jgi:hypothetical protein